MSFRTRARAACRNSSTGEINKIFSRTEARMFQSMSSAIVVPSGAGKLETYTAAERSTP